MKTRIISALVGIVLLLLILLQPITWIFSLGISILCGLAVYELLHETKIVKSNWIIGVSVAFSTTVPFWNRMDVNVILLLLLIYGTSIGIIHIFNYSVQSIVKTLFAGFVTIWASIALSVMSYVRSLNTHGLYLTFLLLMIPWLSDTGAYFTGYCCGKHKLCPAISPKKTIEGFIGGIITSVIICVAVTALYNFAWSVDGKLSLLFVAFVSLIGAFLSVFGDLTASIIKRESNIKDYGKIMPGHGGVMDRFDSLLFTAPFVWVMLCFFVF